MRLNHRHTSLLTPSVSSTFTPGKENKFCKYLRKICRALGQSFHEKNRVQKSHTTVPLTLSQLKVSKIFKMFLKRDSLTRYFVYVFSTKQLLLVPMEMSQSHFAIWLSYKHLKMTPWCLGHRGVDPKILG